MKIYIAGPMSGIPQFNYPAFIAAGEALKDDGFTVLNPAEMDSPELQAAALASRTGNFADLKDTKETWGDMLSEDVKIIADEVDCVCLLPGWPNSRGARLEAFVAMQVQKPVYEYPYVYDPIPPHMLMQMIGNYTVNQGNTDRYKGEDK